MLNLDQILTQYPGSMQIHRESILKEYLQYKILNSIFNSKYADKLAFLGGTALRLIYGNTRFSEDMDFDNLAVSQKEFKNLGKIIKGDLEMEGLEVEIKVVTKNAYHIKIRIPRLLFDIGLSSFTNQKILIQVETAPQNLKYLPDTPLLNKFEVFTQINVVPKDTILAQKIYTCVNRNRIMGRDFFDIIFLYGIGAKPDFNYLKKYLGIENEKKLKEYLLEKTSNLNFKLLSQDVEPLLIDPRNKKNVLLFREFLLSQHF